ncbi:endothelial cell-selective adhesion molecule isoform X2 [Lepisosteus oculatus]|uniref:endothelial cell-selective adhesion molecule isoform X2 n=1 Tax=Lepisosteus oculatus TaxID=7918 RepID=UPI0035F52226
METVTCRKLGTLLSLTLLCGFAVKSQTQFKVEVVEGQAVVLDANYSSTSSIGRNSITWTFMANTSSPLQVISYSTELSPGDPIFVNRVGFVNKMPSNIVSIYINKTVESDSGRYVCSVIIPGNQGFIKPIDLNVKVPPSVPACSITGEPVLRGNITLNCKSESGKPVPVYKWMKTAPTNEVFFFPVQNEQLGTLRLNNLTMNMTGKYVCTASNSAGSETCFINLEVSSPMNVGLIAGATVGCILGFLVIVLCLVFILKRKRDSEDDMANEIKEDAQAPKRVSWAKSGTGSDIISKNGTLSSIATGTHPRDAHLIHYPPKPASDTASIVTATGSPMSYRPDLLVARVPDASALRGLPGYNSGQSLSKGPATASRPSSNGSPEPRTDGAQPQAPRPPLIVTSMTTSNLLRMGGVPVMVPAQNQAGSLV